MSLILSPAEDWRSILRIRTVPRGSLRVAILAPHQKREQINHSRSVRNRRTVLRLLRRVLGVLVWREFAAFHVDFVYFCVVLPLLGQVIQRKNRRDRADRHARAAIDALYGIDVELRDIIEARTAIVIGRVLLRVDAIYRAGIDAGGVLYSDTGFGNDVCHGPPPPSFFYGMPW